MSTERALSCPRCTEPRPVLLKAVTVGGVTIEACPSCRGAWLDHDEWAPLVGLNRAVQHPRTIPFGVVPPPCPTCPDHREAFGRRVGRPPLVPRAIVEVPEVEVDLCQTCGGAWLDGGELATLRERLAALTASEAATTEAEAPPRPKVRAAFTRDPAETFTYLESLRDVLSRLFRS